MKGKIAIVFHEKDRYDDWHEYYKIVECIPYWREWGFETEMLFGVRGRADADLAILHVDLSVVPGKYLRFAQRFPRTLNGKVSDIRKSTISTIRRGPDDTYDGPVILKTNLNAGGAPERRNLPRLQREYARLRWRMTRRADRMTDDSDYRLFDSLKDVPRRFFRDSRFVVEKFIPEVEGDSFFIRSYIFLGDGMTSHRLRAQAPIVKSWSKIDFEPVELHPDVPKLARSLNFDYGKFDYVVHNGEATVFDCNKTVGRGTSRFDDTPQQKEVQRRRARGILKYFS